MAHELLIRCSSLGKIMTEPKSKAEVLSVGAKTYMRELAAQAILGIDFEVSSKEMSTGIQCEDASIALVNEVYGTKLVKNTVRKTNRWLTGEADLIDVPADYGRDTKTAWSAATYPILVEDVNPASKIMYDWQGRGCMGLWGVSKWYIDYCLVDTPEELYRNEPIQMHVVGHIPAHMRVTTWVVERDLVIEAAIYERVAHARAYYRDVIAEFDRTHKIDGQRPEAIVEAAPSQAPAPAVRTVAPAELAAADF